MYVFNFHVAVKADTQEEERLHSVLLCNFMMEFNFLLPDLASALFKVFTRLEAA